MNGFYGNYRGEVIRNDDPLKAGRVKINIFGVYDSLSEEEIPWAIYADSFMGGSSEAGSIVVPEIGAHVWCFFEGGDHHLPVFWAGAPAVKDNIPDTPEESRSEESTYPHNKVFKTAGGFVFEIDDSDGNQRLRIYHPSGSSRMIDNDGNVSETIVGDKETALSGDLNETRSGNLNDNVEGDRTMTSGGSTTVEAGGDITIDAGGSTITISSGGDISIASGGNVVVSGAMIMLN